MVFTLSDLKHLETTAEIANKTPEIPEVSVLPTKSEDTSLTPTLLSLCNKLRAKGFFKQATALEKNLLLLKTATAQTHLYRAHKETGEDLINSAHPDGDNKIVPDVSDNLGDVETIVSRHKKIVDVIQKEPTGKLASYVRQCKIALGAEENAEYLYQVAGTAFEKFRGVYDAVVRKLGEDSRDNEKWFSAIQNMIDKKDVYHTEKMEDFLVNTLNDLKDDKEPGFFSSGQERLVWQDEVLPMLEAAYKHAEDFRNAVAKIRKLETEEKVRGAKEQVAENKPAGQAPTNDLAQQLMTDMRSVAKSIDQHRAQVRAKNLPNANELTAWLDKAEKFANDMVSEYSNLANKADPKTHDQYAAQLKQLSDKLQGFATRWGV
jgi:hypothetical protein